MLICVLGARNVDHPARQLAAPVQLDPDLAHPREWSHAAGSNNPGKKPFLGGLIAVLLEAQAGHRIGQPGACAAVSCPGNPPRCRPRRGSGTPSPRADRFRSSRDARSRPQGPERGIVGDELPRGPRDAPRRIPVSVLRQAPHLGECRPRAHVASCTRPDGPVRCSVRCEPPPAISDASRRRTAAGAAAASDQ